jgi:hypothetical protein
MRILVLDPRLDGVEPQHISNVLWACAKLRINPGDAALNSMLQAMARPAMLEAVDTQALANTVWAVSELQQQCGWQPQVDRRVWQRLRSELQLSRVADKGQPQHVASTLLALARLSAAPAAAEAAATTEPVIEAEFARQCSQQLLQGRTAQQLKSWEAQAVANCMWACGRLGVYEAGFFDRAAAAARGWLSSALRADVLQVALACRLLPCSQQQLLDRLVGRTEQLLLPHPKPLGHIEPD